ncbi:hypothetical protein [Frankia sp. R82]|uniref:hypothetical protein n=1 Tax=Frankia sp. R82 TaxID=2950553 RepID=UPI00204471DC|nr:hypothetical protein [Frankia sp. R82]
MAGLVQPAASFEGGAYGCVHVAEGMVDAMPADKISPLGVQGRVGAVDGGGFGVDDGGGEAVQQCVRRHPQPWQVRVGGCRTVAQMGAGQVGVQGERQVRVLQGVQARLAIRSTRPGPGGRRGGRAGNQRSDAVGDAEEHLGIEPVSCGDVVDGGPLRAGRLAAGVCRGLLECGE